LFQASVIGSHAGVEQRVDATMASVDFEVPAQAQRLCQHRRITDLPSVFDE
jgi:hypothetical protein